MSRSIFFLAASTIALAACQPASEPAESLDIEVPPVVEETVEVVVDGSDAETVQPVAAADEHDDDDHEEGHHDEHDDEDEDHDHEDDEHAHEEDHDHAGGEAHVHGVSDLAASLDGSILSLSVEGALANFDLDETLRTLEDTAPYTDGTVTVVGGDCTRDDATASIRPIGDHGNLMVDLTYTCSAPDAIEAIEVNGFQSFSGFEEVNAIFLTDAGQTAETLTESDTRLDID